MTDIKTWLETTGLKVAEESFKVPPKLPYIIFKDEDKIRGADDLNCIANRSINLELYSNTIDSSVETRIENLLNEKAIEFKKSRAWVDSEQFFQTVYDFDLLEKF